MSRPVFPRLPPAGPEYREGYRAGLAVARFALAALESRWRDDAAIFLANDGARWAETLASVADEVAGLRQRLAREGGDDA